MNRLKKIIPILWPLNTILFNWEKRLQNNCLSFHLYIDLSQANVYMYWSWSTYTAHAIKEAGDLQYRTNTSFIYATSWMINSNFICWCAVLFVNILMIVRSWMWLLDRWSELRLMQFYVHLIHFLAWYWRYFSLQYLTILIQVNIFALDVLKEKHLKTAPFTIEQQVVLRGFYVSCTHIYLYPSVSYGLIYLQTVSLIENIQNASE